MTIDHTALRSLRDRGTELNPPVESESLKLLCDELSTRPGTDFRSVYKLFDGFLTHDGASMLMLWSIEQIISAKNLYGHYFQGLHSVAIGDYLIESDIIVAHISDEEAKVSLLFEQRDLASSIEEFIKLLVAGAFDFH